MSTPALNPLVEKIRAKYPGAYDDMDDAALTKAVLAKHPEYSDLAAPPVPKPALEMKQSAAGTLIGGPEIHGGTKVPSDFNPPNAVGEAISGAALAGGAALAAPAVHSALGPIAGWAARNPLKSYLLYKAIESTGVANHPAVREALPLLLLLGGGKGAAGKAAAGEAAAAEGTAAAEAQAATKVAGEAAVPAAATQAPSGNWPPDTPSVQFQQPKYGFADVRNDAEIKDALQAELDRHEAIARIEQKKQWFANNVPGTPKSVLTGQPDRPVRYTKTPSVAVKPKPVPQDDLTQILQESLEAVRKAPPK